MTESKTTTPEIHQDAPTASPSRDGLPFLTDGSSWSGWKNFGRMLSGRMSAEGKRDYWTERDKREEAANKAWVEKQRDFNLQYSPIVTFLNERIKDLGGHIDKDNINCSRCVSGRAGGGFSPDYGIRLCSNQMTSDEHIEETMAHEMVHAYDHLRYKVDWENNLRHAACSEVRSVFENRPVNQLMLGRSEQLH